MSEKETYLYSRMNSKGFIMIAVFLHLNKQGVSRHIYALRIKLWVLLGWAFSISPFLAYAQLTGGTISTTACQTYNAAHSIVQATPISGEDGTQVITYSWERSTDAFVTFTTTGGSTTVLSDNYTLSGTTYYRRRVDNAGNTAYSNTVIISPKPDVTNIIPSSPNICFGQTSFPVTITALFGPDEYEILWNAGPIALANVSFAPNNFPLGGSINVQVVPNAPIGTYTGTLTLKISSTGCTFTGIPAAAIINPVPTVIVANPSAVCAPLTIDLASAAITSAGSTAGLSYTKWVNALATTPLTNANAVTVTGTYYIKGTNPSTGCSIIKPVMATINPLPTVVITNPLPVCAPLTIDFTSATITSSGSTAGLSYTQWINALATTPLINANVVTATGTYYVKGTNPSTGCRIIKPVTATINPLPTVVITNPLPVCAPLTIDLTSTTITSSGSTVGLSYTQWINALATIPLINANAVTATGTYYIKGTNPSTGCSVIQPVIVTINPQPAVSPITGATVVCVNNSTKLSSATIGGVWSSSNNSVVIINAVGLVTAVGTGSATINYTVTNGNGCINAAITSMNVLTVPAIPTITASGPTTFCNGGSVSIQSSSGTSNQWYKNGVLIAGQTNQTYTATTSGIYTVSVSNGSGCVSNSSSFGTGVTVNPLPTVTVTNPAAVCFPGTIDLTAANLTTGSTNGLLYTQWVNALATTPLTNSTTVTIMGTYYIKGTNPSTGCSVIQPVTATINPLPAVIISNPPAICSPGTFDLTSTNITIGSTAGLVFTQWINVSATTALTNANTVSISGLYFIKGTIPATGCGVVQPVSVTINPLPTGAIQKPVQNYICEGTPTVLTVISNADGYQWYINQKNIPGATGVNYAAIAAGNYGVRFISKEGCTDTTINTTQLALFIKPLLEFIPDKQCLSNPVLFINRSSSNSSGNISWQWDFGDGTNSTLFSPSHIYPAESMYQITLTANNISCPNLTEKLILSYFIESPIPGIRYAEVSAIANQPTVIIARPFGAKYLWKPFNNLNSFTTQSPTVKLTAEQTYTVDITSAEGCVTTDTVLVKIILGSEIYVPQGFTPNGDRQNDRLYPIMEGMKGLTYFKVFNRWGNLVFQVNDAIPANGWNGKFNGIDQPAGSYAWIAEAVDVNGNTIRRSGSVLLIR